MNEKNWNTFSFQTFLENLMYLALKIRYVHGTSIFCQSFAKVRKTCGCQELQNNSKLLNARQYKGQSPFKLFRQGAILFLKYTLWKNIERSRNVKHHKRSLIMFALDSINTTLWVRNKSYALINKKWYIVVRKKWGNWQQLWSETIFRWKYCNDHSLQGRVWRVVTVSKMSKSMIWDLRITFAGRDLSAKVKKLVRLKTIGPNRLEKNWWINNFLG